MRLPLAGPAPEFSLPSVAGGLVSRSEFVGKPLLVMFWCNHCPFVRHVRAEVLAVVHAFLPRGLAVLAINSNDALQVPADGPEAMRAEALAHAYPFPYLIDASQQVARRFSAACTPDFFLFDGAHKLAYRGAFDASSPGNQEPVDGRWLRAAIEAVLDKRPVDPEQRPSLGCGIKWRLEPAEAAGAPNG